MRHALCIVGIAALRDQIYEGNARRLMGLG
jgi:hypothetical protein